MSTYEMLRAMNDEDAKVASAVAAVLPQIARAVDAISAAFINGGRLIYIGAGTSGRLGVLDASECPPTFGVPESMVVGIIAGGDHALRNAVEGAEDSEQPAIDALNAIELSPRDVVVGLAVSGRTPYVLAGLRYASAVGATTVAITCNPASKLAKLAEIAISPVVGPEVLTGSTRLKSGTAQKLILNMLSTASMIKIGKAFGNLMVNLRATNNNLAARSVLLVKQATSCTRDKAEQALAAAGQDVKLAILTLLTSTDIREARKLLKASGGVLRCALAESRQSRITTARETA